MGNFTTFLTLFGEKLHGTDPEGVILKAFKCFDPEGKKAINGEQLKRLLMAMGERFTQEEVDAVFEEQECDDAGDFDYIEFVRFLSRAMWLCFHFRIISLIPDIFTALDQMI